jgi:hypothetical protein
MPEARSFDALVLGGGAANTNLTVLAVAERIAERIREGD